MGAYEESDFSSVTSGVSDIAGILKQLTDIYSEFQNTQTNSQNAGTNRLTARQNIAESKANIALNQKKYLLAVKAQDLASKLAVAAQAIADKELGLKQEAGRLAQSKQVEDMLTSGTARNQSEVTFAQGQQDRVTSQRFLNAMAKGVAAGLASRPKTAVLPTQRPVTGGIGAPTQAYSQTPTIAGVTA